MAALYAFDPAKRKKVKIGDVIGTGVIIEKDSKKHLMRVMDGYGIQASAMQVLQENDIQDIYIHETDTDIKWKVSVADWRIYGRLADYGNGKQWFLSRKFMRQYKPNMDIIK